MGVMNELQYRANFWVQLLNSLIALGTGVVAIAVVYAHTDTLGGWSAPELLTVMGVHLVIGGVLKAVVQPNMWRLLQDVEEGNLDYTLTRPADSQLLVSVREVSIWNGIDVFLGLGVIVWALTEISGDFGLIDGVGFVAALVCGALIIYSIWIAAATIAFKAIRIDNLMQLLNSVYEAGRWPVGIYPGWLRGTLTFIVPLAFAITVPAEIVSSRVNWWWLGLGFVITIIALIGSRFVWRRGIRNYSGASA
jgi:ABC-2 type transport system permease protein